MSWIMQDGYPTNTDFIDLPSAAMATPYPHALWRIEEGYNDGLPFNMLLPDIVHIVPVEPVRQKEYICVFDMETPQNGFDNNGLAVIFPTVCRVSEELNGEWSLYMEHPVDTDGKWTYLLEYNILKIMGQLYVIYKVDVQYNGGKGIVKVYADHIFYQLSCGFVYPADNGIPDVPKVQNVINRIMTRSDFHHESGQTFYAYTYNSNIERTEQTVNYEYDITSGATTTELLMGGNGVISQRGGELYRNNFYFSLNNRMENAYENGFELRVGRDLRGIKRSVDLSTVCTYFKGIDNYGNWFAISYTPGGIERQMPRHVVRGAKFNYDKYEGSMERLTADCYAFFGENCRPKITYTIDLIDVRNNPDFAVFTNNPRYKVGDKGIVYDERLDINLTLEITKTVIDAISGEVTQVTFGEIRGFTRPRSYSNSLVTPDNAALIEEIKRNRILALSSWSAVANYTWGQLSEFSWNQVNGNPEWGESEEE